MINIHQFHAAQEKARKALIERNHSDWHDALHECSQSYQPGLGFYLTGKPALMAVIGLDDAVKNFESYGDLTICSGDDRRIKSEINLDIDPVIKSDLIIKPKWHAN